MQSRKYLCQKNSKNCTAHAASINVKEVNVEVFMEFVSEFINYKNYVKYFVSKTAVIFVKLRLSHNVVVTWIFSLTMDIFMR